MPNYTRPRGRRDPEPTDLAAVKRAAATAAAMTQESRPTSRHASLLAELRNRLGLAADATEARPAARDAGRRDERRDPGAHPLLPR